MALQDPNGNAPKWVEHIFNDIKNIYNNAVSFTDGVVLGIGESITYGFTNVVESYKQPSNENLYYAGKVAGNAVVLISSAVATVGAAGATLLVTSTGQVYVYVPAAAAATSCSGLVTSSAANI